MSENKNLIPIEQKMVVFYDDEITAVLVAENDEQRQVYLPLRHLCSLIGVNYQGQKDRIDRDPVLSKKLKGISVTLTPAMGRRGGGTQVMNCLPLRYLNGWLFGINANRVKAEIKDKLIRYQEECYDVLWEAFGEGRLTADDPTFAELLQTDSPAAQAYKMMAAMMKLARQQLLLESQVSQNITQLQNHDQRLEQLESQLGQPDRLITPAQAAEISQAVKAIAMKLSKQSGRNEYGGVYGELYRRYEIPSYKELPANKFDSCIKWLNQWLQSLIQDTPF